MGRGQWWNNDILSKMFKNQHKRDIIPHFLTESRKDTSKCPVEYPIHSYFGQSYLSHSCRKCVSKEQPQTDKDDVGEWVSKVSNIYLQPVLNNIS